MRKSNDYWRIRLRSGLARLNEHEFRVHNWDIVLEHDFGSDDEQQSAYNAASAGMAGPGGGAGP